MHKNLPITIITIIVLATVGFLSMHTLQKNQPSIPSSSATSTAVALQTGDALASIDYSSLEKDRLYTEEEGKYANLNETGKKLLRAILKPPECMVNPNGNYCDDYEWIIMNSSIIALQNGMLLFNEIGVKGDMHYNFYDITKKKMVGKSIEHFSNIRNNDIIIYVDDHSIPKEQTLHYFRIGMSQFSPIPKSTIYFDESYLYQIGMGFMDSKWTIVNNSLKISIFREQPNVVSVFWPKLREVTFDLNILP